MSTLEKYWVENNPDICGLYTHEGKGLVAVYLAADVEAALREAEARGRQLAHVDSAREIVAIFRTTLDEFEAQFVQMEAQAKAQTRKETPL